MPNLSGAGFHSTEVIILEERPRRWGWLLALGILTLVAGTIGIIASVAFTIGGVLFFGGALLAVGILQLVHAFTARETQWVGRLSMIALGLLYLLMGGLIIWDPLAASLGITLMIGALFAVAGVFRLAEAWRRRSRQWRWVAPLIVGLLNLAFAAVVLFHWPVSGLWVIGLIIALEFLLNGWLLVFAALATRRASSRARAHETPV
jgi:uncharacterized membrane protein HdeD (DUF308 family)